MIVSYVIIVLVAIVLAYAIGMYNALVRLRQRVREAWSDIDVQLKRRYDLIPNLVETVKGYAKHESQVFENVTKARVAALLTNVQKKKTCSREPSKVFLRLPKHIRSSKRIQILSRSNANCPIPKIKSKPRGASTTAMLWISIRALSNFLRISLQIFLVSLKKNSLISMRFPPSASR